MPYTLDGIQFMGNNVKERLKFCGENVTIHPLAKIYNAEKAELDDFCRIFDYVYIDAGAGLKIGKYATLTWQVLIEGQGKTEIQDRAFLGPGTKIITSINEHNGYRMVEHLPEGQAKIISGDITIEKDAHLGANCVVFPGITIGEGAVVGANSLVNKNLEPWGIYVGTPCRRIGTREKPPFED